MKKTWLILTLSLLLIFALSLPALATAHDGLCGCGRNFALVDSEDYMIFDCLGCGRNYTSCTCHTCWCGSDLTRTQVGEMEVVFCDDCELPCEDCICRDRAYYNALQGVEQGLTGAEIPNPDNGLLITLAVLLPFGTFLALYFTVYRRRSAARNRKNRAPVLEKELDSIEREPDAKKRYAMAKAREEAKRDGDPRILDREAMLLCLRKNELLTEALEEDWLKETAADNRWFCRKRNDLGFAGSVETINRLWDFKEKSFTADRKEISGETPAQALVKWDTKEESIALFEIVTPLNGIENNRLHPASNLTRFAKMIFDEAPLMNRKTDPDSAEELKAALERIVPGCDAEKLMALPKAVGDTCKDPGGLPEEASPRRMGEKLRFPGGRIQ